jgi:hypothetical protein
LIRVLQSIPLPRPTAPPAEAPNPPTGRPRAQYGRTYILLNPQTTDPAWVAAAARATWNKGRFTIGGSADDAGIGDLNVRRVFAINPEGWGDDLAAWYAQHYPGVEYQPIQADSPETAERKLRQRV